MFDWLSFLKDYSIDYRTSGPGISAGTIAINCPHHENSGTKFLLGILGNGKLSCWSCGSHSAYETVLAIVGDKNEANRIWKIYQSNKLSPIQKAIKRGQLPEIKLPGKVFTKYELEYLHSRGITDYHIDKYDIRSGGVVNPVWHHRIVLPISVNGKIVSATGRTISKSNPVRYWSLPPEQSVVNLKHTIYGGDFVNHHRPIIVVEGPLDAVLGGDNFVSVYGVNITDEQYIELSKYNHIIVALDQDDAGDSNRELIAYTLDMMGVSVVEFVTWSDHKDIGDMPIECIQELRQEVLHG